MQTVLITVGIEKSHVFSQLLAVNIWAPNTFAILVSGYVNEAWRKQVLAVLSEVREELIRQGIRQADYILFDFTDPNNISIDRCALEIVERFRGILGESNEHIYLIGGGLKMLSLALYLLSLIWYTFGEKRVRVYLSMEEALHIIEVPIPPLGINLSSTDVKLLKTLLNKSATRKELANMLGSSYANVDIYVRRLISKGLATERKIQRSRIVELTPLGRLIAYALLAKR